jgi:hypothetical protein
MDETAFTIGAAEIPTVGEVSNGMSALTSLLSSSELLFPLRSTSVSSSFCEKAERTAAHPIDQPNDFPIDSSVRLCTIWS